MSGLVEVQERDDTGVGVQVASVSPSISAKGVFWKEAGRCSPPKEAKDWL
jgi:hypothetical protein